MTTTPQSDISDLTLLLKQMFSSAPKAAKSRRTATAATPPPPPRPEPGDWKFRPGWTDQSVVLHIIQYNCTCCNSTSTAPSPYLMLRRYHPKLGIYEEALTIHSPKHMELPRRLSHETREVPHCLSCFIARDYSSRQMTFDFHSAISGACAGGDLDGLLLSLAGNESAGSTAPRGAEGAVALSPSPERSRHCLRPSIPMAIRLDRDGAQFPLIIPAPAPKESL